MYCKNTLVTLSTTIISRVFMVAMVTEHTSTGFNLFGYLKFEVYVLNTLSAYDMRNTIKCEILHRFQMMIYSYCRVRSHEDFIIRLKWFIFCRPCGLKIKICVFIDFLCVYFKSPWLVLQVLTVSQSFMVFNEKIILQMKTESVFICIYTVGSR